MTTVLAHFYARAALILATLIAFAFLFATIALAQDAVAPAATDDGSIVGLIRDSFTAALIAIVTGAVAWLSRRADSWLGGRIDLNATLDAVNWQSYVKDAADDAFAYAQNRIMPPEKITTLADKSKFLAAAYAFIAAHNDDIVKFADKNGNGVIDILEALLAKRVPLPSAPDEPPMQQMGLMGAVPSKPARPRHIPTPPAPPIPTRRRPEQRPLQ